MTEYSIALASAVDSANRMRLAYSALLPDIGSLKSRSGLLDSGGAVTLTSGMGISVSALRGYIQGAGSTQGGYLVVSDAAKALTFDDGGASNRTDLVVARLYHDAFDGSGQTKFAVEIFKGTPGAGTPATPAGAIKLAEKVITAGMSAGTGGLGTVPVDKRPPRLVPGGPIPVLDSADRNTLTPFPGLMVFRIDLLSIQINLSGVAADSAWHNLQLGDSGWSNLTLASGWAAGFSTPQIRKIGNVVHLRGFVVKTAGMAATTSYSGATAPIPPGTIPAASRPGGASGTVRHDASLPGHSVASEAKGFVDTDGSIAVVTGATVPAYICLDGLSGYLAI